MTRKLISVDIVNHQLAGMPHFIEVASDKPSRYARAMRPIRGIGTAALLSLPLWGLLVAAVH